jgi:hypothetical protein
MFLEFSPDGKTCSLFGHMLIARSQHSSVDNVNFQRSLHWPVRIKMYKTVIWTVIPHECESWLLTLREEHKLRVFASRVLRGIFGPKGEEVTGGWGQLPNEKFPKFRSLRTVRMIELRSMWWAGHVAHLREMRNAHRVCLNILKVWVHMGNVRVDGRMVLKYHQVEWVCATSLLSQCDVILSAVLLTRTETS